MRLVCPNCSAQYEIDLALVPEDGRDVQCSNCGHTWFEMPSEEGSAVEDDAPETVEIDSEPEAPESEAEAAETEDEAATSDEAVLSQAAIAIAAASEVVADTDDDTDNDDPFDGAEDPFEGASVTDDAGNDDVDLDSAAPIVGTTVKARRPADAADLDILREEAERELSQRRAPPSETLEAQTDLGLDSIQARNTPSRALRARMARSDGNLGQDNSNKTRMMDFEEGSEADYKAPQRDLLPDIDEINSTLKPGSKRKDPGAQAVQRKGFRMGFGVMVLTAVALITAYAFAPAIAQAVPAIEPTLVSYVDGANQVRDWIDGLLASFS